MAARGHKPTKRGNPPPPIEFSEDAPTSIYESGDDRGTPTPPPEPPKIQAISMKTPADPKIQAISMKTPADPSIKPIAKLEREMPHVKLRAMSEMAKAQQPQNLGNLAPPYDPAEARKRTLRDYVLWGCLAVILASAIALIVWFVAT